MRRFLIAIALSGAVAVAAVAALPWWLGAAAAAIGPRFGLTFADYQREGYVRFKLRDVQVRRPGVDVRIEEVATDTPVVWLWRRLTGDPSELVGGAWSVEVEPQAMPPKPDRPRGWVPLTQTLRQTAQRLERWAPRAAAGPGVVTWPRGRLTLAPTTWRDRVASSPGLGYKALEAAVKVAISESGEIRAELDLPAEEARARLESKGASIAGEIVWWGVSATASAEFPATGWMPVTASLRAPEWQLPGSRARIGAQYATLRGAARVEWREEELRADISAEGVPAEGAKAPPLKVDVRGRGEAGVFVAEAVDMELPGVTARLSEPVTLDRRGHVRSEPSRFSFEIDASRLPWIEAGGTLRGEGRIAAADDGVARVDFEVSGEKLTALEVDIARLQTRGIFAWPRLEIASGTLVGGDNRELSWRGAWDFRARALHGADVRGEIGRRTLARWLPATPEFEAVAIEATAEGAWPELVHEGEVSATGLKFPSVKPLALVAHWRGRGERVEAFEAKADAGQSSVVASGSADRAQVRLAQLEIAKDNATLLQLAGPTSVRWTPRRGAGPFRFDGPRGSIEGTVEWGAAGQANLELRGVQSNWFRDIVELPPVEWRVQTLTWRSRWENGPLEYSANAAAEIGLGRDRVAQVFADVSGGGTGVEIGSLRVAEGSGVIMAATGHLPVVVRPGGKPLLEIDEDARLALEGQSSSNPEFWKKLTEVTGVELVNPEAVVNLHGTWREPRGEVRVSVARVAAVPGRFEGPWPTIEALDLRFAADSEGARLEPLAVKINGQDLRVTGRVPLAPKDWRRAFRDPETLAENGDLRIQIPDAELAALARQFPGVMAPIGRLQLDLTVKRDAMLDGFLRVTGASSRPLGPLGALQDINAEVRFHGREAELTEVAARMGGQPVMLQGRAELPLDGDPQIDLALKGANLPFVRRTGLLLRGDIDLTLKTAAAGLARIGGKVRLRDSLFLADVRSLIPTGAKGNAARAPYFSVEEAPLNAWQLDVTVEGPRFLRLRTPVFNGTVSATARLEGTLGNPRATGEAVIEEGRVRLPFSTFEVRQGLLRLTREQPEPQLMITGTTRRYGYDLRMELSGPASSPNLTFSSSPPLEAEQVLLLVMTGQAPNDEITTTDRQRVARLGAFFGQSLLGSFAGDSGGADRLTISSGEEISAQGRETYSIEYRLDDRWALTGEYDEFDDYYGGLKWRIYPRKEKPDEPR